MIDKFALTEAKGLIKLHTSLIFQWAQATQDSGATVVSAALKDALLTSSIRLHELLEALPVAELPTTTDPETGERVTING